MPNRWPQLHSQRQPVVCCDSAQWHKVTALGIKQGASD